MEGHQFAIFAMRLSSDKRYIVSVSNRFITFDVVTSDLARQVYPGVEGLMMDLELSSDDKYAAAFTNNYQIILVNNLVSEFIVIENPFRSSEVGGSKKDGSVLALRLLDNKLVVIGARGWAVLNMAGEVETRLTVPGRPSSKYIHSVRMTSLTAASFVMWSGLETSAGMTVKTYKDGSWCADLKSEGGVVVTSSLEKVYTCHSQAGGFSVCCHTRHPETDGWNTLFTTEPSSDKILMLSLSADER